MLWGVLDKQGSVLKAALGLDTSPYPCVLSEEAYVDPWLYKPRDISDKQDSSQQELVPELDLATRIDWDEYLTGGP